MTSFFVLLFYVSSVSNQKPSYTSNDYPKVVEKENKKLPIMVDSETALYNINFANNTLTYQYRLVNTDLENINKEMLYNYMRNEILKKVCNTPTLNRTLASGYSLSFMYNDKNSKPIFNININPSDCNIKIQ